MKKLGLPAWALAGVAGIMLSPSALWAQGEDADGGDAVTLDNVQVTGSRLTRAQIEGALPVTVISREDIDARGDTNISDFLRTLTFNTSGSFEAASGFGGGQQGAALLDLRGIGSERTLILIDGRRIAHTPAFGAAAQDVNTVPMAAVERIEILREGASAVYGSDAIGGVVNIITRKDYQGVSLSVQGERPTQDGGDGNHASLLAGISSRKGHMYMSIDHFDRDIIFMRDRDYLFDVEPSPLGFPGAFVRTSDGTIGGAVANPDPARNGAFFDPFPNCPETFGSSSEFPLSGVFPFEVFSPEDQVCGYQFAGIAGKTAAIKRDTLSVNGSYEIAKDLTGFGRVSMTRAESFGRFAPAPVTPVFGGVTMAADNPNNPTAGEAGGPYDLIILYRLAANGPRDSMVDGRLNSTLMGLRGTLDFADTSEWEIGVFENRFVQKEVGTGYGLRPPLQGLIDSGAFDPFNPTDDAVAQFDHTILSDNQFLVRGVDFNLSMGNVMPNSDFRLPVVVGGEYRDESFRSLVDSQSAAGNVFGSAGSSSAGGRSYYALFAETGISLLEDKLELGFAARLDSYSDFGSEVSPKISAAFRPINSVLIRASYSEGFRAPDLGILNQQPAQSFPSSIDTLGCQTDPNNAFACDARQRETFLGGNPNLGAEKSENINLGVVLNVTENLSFALDYYDIELTDGIANLTAQDVLDNEARCAEQGRECNPDQEGTVIRTGPVDQGGQVDIILAPAANFAIIETQGLDFSGRYVMDTGYGRFTLDGSLSYVFSFKDQTSPFGSLRENVDTTEASSQGDAFPEYRATLGTNWEMGMFDANLTINHIPKIRDCTPQNVIDGAAACGSSLSDYTTMNLQFGWQTPWKSKLTVGVRNLLDEDPPLSQVIGTPDFPETTLAVYDVFGRVPYLRWSHDFN